MADITKLGNLVFKRIKEGDYRYELVEKHSRLTNLPKDLRAEVPGYILLEDGWVNTYPTYRWDGATGVPKEVPEKWVLEASLPHDSLYQLFREGKLDIKYRKLVDEMMYQDFIKNGMPVVIAKAFYGIVRAIGWIFARPKKIKK